MHLAASLRMPWRGGLAGILLALCFAPTAASGAASTAEQAWVAQAEGLVEFAASGRAGALQFRTQVRESREVLREIVRAAHELDAPDAQRSGLHRNMVLMNALLDAAAACHQGGRIVCPPDLMRQMRAQLQVLDELVGDSAS